MAGCLVIGVSAETPYATAEVAKIETLLSQGGKATETLKGSPGRSTGPFQKPIKQTKGRRGAKPGQ